MKHSDTLRLKKDVYCGKTQTLYAKDIYPPFTFRPYLLEENPDCFEVVKEDVKKVEPAQVIDQSSVSQIITHAKVVNTTKKELPEPTTISLNAKEDKVKVTRTRRSSTK